MRTIILIIVAVVLGVLAIIFHAAANEMRDNRDGINNALDYDDRNRDKYRGQSNRRDH